MDDLERQLQDHISVANEQLLVARQAYMPADRQQLAATEAERNVVQASKIYQQLELQLRKSPGLELTYRPVLKQADADINAIKRSLSTLKDPSASAGAPGDDLDIRWANQRSKLLQTNAIQDNTDASLDRSVSTAARAEATGIAALSKLEGQGRQLRNARDGLIEIDEHMSQSKKIMNQMYLNVIGNKLVLILIIMAELISIGLIVYFKYIK